MGARTVVYISVLPCCSGGKDRYLHLVSVLFQWGQGQLFTFGFCPVSVGARTVVDIWFLSCCSGGKDSC